MDSGLAVPLTLYRWGPEAANRTTYLGRDIVLHCSSIDLGTTTSEPAMSLQKYLGTAGYTHRRPSDTQSESNGFPCRPMSSTRNCTSLNTDRIVRIKLLNPMPADPNPGSKTLVGG